jgi:hypothetical protein
MIARTPTRCGSRSVIHGGPRGDDPRVGAPEGSTCHHCDALPGVGGLIFAKLKIIVKVIRPLYSAIDGSNRAAAASRQPRQLHSRSQPQRQIPKGCLPMTDKAPRIAMNMGKREAGAAASVARRCSTVTWNRSVPANEAHQAVHRIALGNTVNDVEPARRCTARSTSTVMSVARLRCFQDKDRRVGKVSGFG